MVGNRGSTWTFYRGVDRYKWFYAPIDDTLTDAVVLQGKYVIGVAGTDVISYTWPEMKEVTRYHFEQPVVRLRRRWQTSVVASTRGSVVELRFDGKTFSAHNLFEGRAPLFDASSGIVYVVTEFGQVLRVRDTVALPILFVPTPVRDVVASPTHLVCTEPVFGVIHIVSFLDDTYHKREPFKLTPNMTYGADGYFWVVDATSLKRAIVNRLHIDSQPEPQATVSGSRVIRFPTAELRPFHCDPDMCIISRTTGGELQTYHPLSGYVMNSDRFAHSLRRLAKTSDSTIAVTAGAPPYELEFVVDGDGTIPSLLSVNWKSGVANSQVVSPIASKRTSRLECLDTTCLVQELDTAIWRVRPSSAVQLSSRGSFWKGGTTFWFAKSSQYSLDEFLSSSDSAKTWKTMVGPWPKDYYSTRHFTTVNGNMLYGTRTELYGVHPYEVASTSAWQLKHVATPPEALQFRSVIPIDNGVIWVLDEIKNGTSASTIWTVNYSNNSIDTNTFTVPGVGLARMIHFVRLPTKTVGLWRGVGTGTLGAFATEDRSIRAYSLDTTGFFPSTWYSPIALDDTTVVMYEDLTGRIVRMCFGKPTTVNVAADNSSQHREASPRSVLMTEGTYDWHHGLAEASISLYTMQGEHVQLDDIKSTQGHSVVNVKEHGLYVVIATNGRDMKTMLLLR